MPVSTLEQCFWGGFWFEYIYSFTKRFLVNLMPGIFVILTMSECWCLAVFLEHFILLIFKMNALLNASFKQTDTICLLIL